MEVTYKRNLHKSYMCIKGQETVREEYELVMLESQKIPCLLPMQISVVDGIQNYLYEISGKQQIGDYLSGKKINYEILCKLLYSIRKLCGTLPEYLLREERICLEQEFIYVNLEDGGLYFTYLPFLEVNLPESFERFMEQILRKIDHKDHAATELGYRIYQACTNKNADIGKMLEAALEVTVLKNTDKKPADIGDTDEQEEIEEHMEGRYMESQHETAAKKQNICKVMINRIYELLSIKVLMDKLPADMLFSNMKDKIAIKRSVVKQSLTKKKGRKESKGKAYQKNRQGDMVEEKQEYRMEEKEGRRIEEEHWMERETVIHPTEILGVHRQEPTGKLVYQGIHGCADFIIEGEEYLLGKNGQQADGVIDAEGVSRLHARISREGNVYYIEDLNSTNGTYLNEAPLEYRQKKVLDINDHIRFGAEEYVFC